MRKIFYGLGAVGAVVAPLVAVVSCAQGSGTADIITKMKQTQTSDTMTFDFSSLTNKDLQAYASAAQNGGFITNAHGEKVSARYWIGQVADSILGFVNTHRDLKITIVIKFPKETSSFSFEPGQEKIAKDQVLKELEQ